MSKRNEKRKEPLSGLKTNSKHVSKKSKLISKKNKMKVSDMSSDASSVQSLVTSGKSGHSAMSSAMSSSSAKKLQCDLCKLSYSSDKELTEHLVSLMHHTKLENKDEDAIHNCVLCHVEYKSMADYRKHIGLSSHLDEIARLRGEKVERKKPKHSRWDSKVSRKEQNHYKSSKGHNKFRDNYVDNNMESASWNYNQNQNKNYSPFGFYQTSCLGNMRAGGGGSVGRMSSNNYGSTFMYQDDISNQQSRHSHNQSFANDFPMYNNNKDPNSWISPEEVYDSYMGSGVQRYEPWGSGMYRKGFSPHNQNTYQYGHRQNNPTGRDFPDQNYFENNQYGHWDEESLQRQEEFLASIDESSERRGNFNWHRHDDRGNQWVYDRQKWRSGAKSSSGNIPTSDKSRFTDPLETSVQSMMDRKRPMEDEKPRDITDTAGSKTCHSHNKEPPVADRLGSVKHRHSNTPSMSSKSTSEELDNNSADLLQRAERLCKELREKRLASTQVLKKGTSTKQQENVLSQKLDAISEQRQKKYFKGIIKEVPDFSSADSGISVGGLVQDPNKDRQVPASQKSSKETLYSSKRQQRPLDDIKKSLQETIPVSENTELESRKKMKARERIVNETALPTQSKQGSSAPQRERRDSSSNTGSKQPLKAVVRPQVLTKDSLKKMINAPSSRDERVHLAKIFNSRDDAQPKPGTTKSRPLQLEGLYDSQSLDPDAAADDVTSSNLTSVIKLEDLRVNVREQILSLIGASCPGVEEIQLPMSGPLEEPSHSKSGGDAARVSSNKHASLNKDKKQREQVSVAKKKIDVDGENVKKKKAKKKDAENYNLKRPKTKDSKNTSTETLDTDCDKVTSSKSKFSSAQANVINLIDSDEEFQLSPTLLRDSGSTSNKPLSKDMTPPKKKKKKKKEGKTADVSSSMESDDVSHGFSSQTSLSLLNNSKSKLSPNPKFPIESGEASIDTELSHSYMKEHLSDKHVKDLHHFTSKPSGKKKTTSSTTDLLTTTKRLSEQESSLNSQNVREKFPLLLKTPTSTPSSPLPSTAAQVSSVVSYLSSTSSPSYAKALPVSASSLSPSRASTQTINSISAVVSGPSTTLHSGNLQLPPSIHLANRPSQSQPTAALQETQPESTKDKVEVTWTSGLSKAEVEEDNVIVMDESDDLPVRESDRLSLSSSAYSGEASSQAMAELLYLSEREEQIKQEAQSMELRLTRLHRLLEQAVVQINKCTERRTQLQQEEKDISSKRLSLLRDAAKGRTSATFENLTSSVHNKENGTSEPSIDSLSLEKLATAPATSSSVPTLPLSSTSSTPILSKADWLAKFSSFLPPDPTQGEERHSVSHLNSSASVLESESGQSLQPANPPSFKQKSSTLSSQIPGADVPSPAMRKDESSFGVSSFPSMGSESVDSNIPSTASTTFTSNAMSTASTKVFKDLTCMYVGSFLTPIAPIPKVKTSLMSKGMDKASGLVAASESTSPSDYTGSQNLDRTPDKIIPLLKDGAKLYRSGSVGTEEDSDIGSVASSLASGTSLGEQIAQYCRAVPGASLEPTGPRGGVGTGFRQQTADLSVIISSDASLSDHLSGSNQRGEEEESSLSRRKGSERGKDNEETMNMEDESRVTQILQDSELGRRGVYGSFNQEDVRSAEALHVMERNYDENLDSRLQKSKTPDIATHAACHPSKSSTVSVSDWSVNGAGKKKKLLTRQEREASQLTRHRKRWLVSSSSDEEQVEDNGAGGNQDADPVVMADKRRTNADSDERVNIAPIKIEPKEEVFADIVVAECDSSTNLGIVDSESIRQRTQTLREMRESFERTFGRSPRSKETMSKEGDFSVGINSTTPEASSVKPKGPDRIEHETMLSLGSRPERRDSLKNEVSKETDLQRYKGSGKPVCDMQVVDSHLYVGYQNLGISVFDLEAPTEDNISEHPFGHLECFYVTEINETLTVIVGDGCFLTFCSANDTQIPSRDMGTPIRCMLYLDFNLFLGLDTGEICVINAKTMEQRSRFICSDHLLRSMAVAQEGAMKLLCVAAQDGSISIVNSRQGLLLRILSGHVKAAFSLQVNNSSVFSCSLDGTVLEQNLHTTTLEHVYRGHSGVVMVVFLYKTYLLTAGTDRLVRCYDVKTHKLLQVYYGAGRGAITKIIVINDKLITGNLDGVVDVIDFNIDSQNICPVSSCSLNFGHRLHLEWHQQEEKHYADTQKNPTLVT